MKAIDQTEEVKVRLFKLTQQFVRKYVSRYYKQYNGVVDDLVMDYYVEFLTPKSREIGKEASLLDKFDDTITSLEYLVKVAVQRKLIDSSRQNPIPMLRIDNFQDEFGDCIADTFGLTTFQDEEPNCVEDFRTFTMTEVHVIKYRFDKLSIAAKAAIKKQFQDTKIALAPAYREVFELVLGEPKEEGEENHKKELVLEVVMDGKLAECKCQQVTLKTVCVLVAGIVLDFNRETGEARSKQLSTRFNLTAKALEWVKENIKTTYHSGIAREVFK